jgi:ribonucleoside-diphosphate reductase alpha chain
MANELLTRERTPSVVLITSNRGSLRWNAKGAIDALADLLLGAGFDPADGDVMVRQAIGRAMSDSEGLMTEARMDEILTEEVMRWAVGRPKGVGVVTTYILGREANRAVASAELAFPDAPGQLTQILVRGAQGDTFWDGQELDALIKFASQGLDLCLPVEEIRSALMSSVADGLTEDELEQTILLNSRTLIERDSGFAKFAGRILCAKIYRESLDWQVSRDGMAGLRRAHRVNFRRYLNRAVKIERLSPALLEYDIDRLADALDPMADFDFDFLGIQTLYDRYLVVDKTEAKARRLETPQFFWMRVAMGLFLKEPEGTREDWVIRLYNLYKTRRFCSSTPTLFNAGTLHAQLSSCYLYKIDDNIESIMLRGIAENAFLSKWAGGLGGSWTAVRGTGAYIKGTNGESQGVIPFLKLHNDQLVAVNQGGKRRGSGCAYLETWHNDILDFLELRKNVGDDRRRAHDMNTANWIPDLFMKRMEAREEWTLFHANETPDLHELYGQKFEARYAEYEALAKEGKIFGKTMPAIELWKQMLKMLFETGHPWITFKDPCNIRSPQDHKGVIHSSNLCTEITLNTSEDETAVCNLGSVVLENHLTPDGALDLQKLRDTVRVAVRALDNVIDLNFYPTATAERSNRRHRPVGLGVMGLHYALHKKGLSFASEEAVAFNDEFMEAVCFFAYEASSDLAAERGSYSTFGGSKWDRGLMPHDTLELLEKERGAPIEVTRGGKLDWEPLRAKIQKQGMRNSNLIAIAPTATIANIMGTSACIEPNYKNLFVKSNLSGEFTVLNPFLVDDLKKLGIWDDRMIHDLKTYDGELTQIIRIPRQLKEIYATAFNVESNFVLDAAARRQKWIDQSQSVNLFLGNADFKALSHMYRAAWRKGLKTTYYLRTLGASNIEKATVDVKKELRGHIGNGTNGEQPSMVDAGEAAAPKACSLEARAAGTTCESCQ